ncbi:magnesium transporter NIPA-domain-containing protein [Xylariaceae sp. FL0804]|nr:magnesium transporter NIPA-domain-containing protein [Xylariaceae sp. FL0804]
MPPFPPSGLSVGSHSHDDGNSGRLGNWSSLIGIITAIVGNMLIALALNVQRYSHIQLHRRRIEARERARGALKRAQSGRRTGYGTTDAPAEDAQTADDEGDGATENDPLAQSAHSGDSAWSDHSGDVPKVDSNYLKSPSWWLGQVLMTVGEMGNFLAYGFAPASIVSPLGVVALISNCVIAPLFFGEVFRKRDFWGVVIAVAGAITVVLSAKQQETKLDPHDVWDAISSMAFEIYMGVTIFLIVLFMWLSPKYGNRTILIDLGLVGLFGGYTALTTKGVSSMLSSTLLRAFTTPVTYGLLIILIGTAVMQVRYVNKALQRFDSTQVIPIQFVLFTLSVIIGSAILYRDFERTTAQQAAKFVGGCLLTFFGVFLITSGRPRHDDDDELSDDENVEETIGLRDQDGSGPYDGTADELGQNSPTSPAPSGRSSRASRSQTSIKPLTPLLSSGGTPSNRRPAAVSRKSFPTPTESSPFLQNPWSDAGGDRSARHGLGATISADSVMTINSIASTAVSEPMQSSVSLPPLNTNTGTGPPPSPGGQAATTPRPSVSSSRPHSHRYSNTFISPSPLSSTVSAVVSDALHHHNLHHDRSPLARRRSVRRMRPSIVNSLFVSHEDNGEPTTAASVSPTNVSEPLLREAADRRGESRADQHYHNQGDEPGSGGGDAKSIRGRARSLSSSLGGLFGRKPNRRSRRHTSDAEAGGGSDGQGRGPLPGSQSSDEQGRGAEGGGSV